MIVMALVVVGAAGYFKLGVDRTPPVDLPSVFVSTRLPGASPAEMESLVAQPIEEAVNTVEGITELRSISGQGNSFIIVQFDLRRNVNVAAEDVRTRVATVVPDLPRDRKSTRLNSSHGYISYAVFCLKKKTTCTDSTSPPTPPTSSC